MANPTPTRGEPTPNGDDQDQRRHKIMGIRRLPGLMGIGLIRIYRYTLSAIMGRQCRHLPTCSEFGEEALGRHGLWGGGWMTVARIWRCNPWGSSGYDPVPPKLPGTGRWYLPWRYGRWRRAGPDGN